MHIEQERSSAVAVAFVEAMKRAEHEQRAERRREWERDERQRHEATTSSNPKET